MVRLAWQLFPISTHTRIHRKEKLPTEGDTAPSPMRGSSATERVEASSTSRKPQAASADRRRRTNQNCPLRNYPTPKNWPHACPFTLSFVLSDIFPSFLLFPSFFLLFDNISKSARLLFVPELIYQKTDSQDGCIHIVSDTRRFPNTFMSWLVIYRETTWSWKGFNKKEQR